MTQAATMPIQYREVAALVTAQEVTIGGHTVLGIRDARDLHRGLGVGRDFTNWIKGRIAKYGFANGQDYEKIEDLSPPNPASSKARPQVTHVYTLSLDMAKELAMVEATDQGRLVRQYFLWCERQLRQLREKTSPPAAPAERPVKWTSEAPGATQQALQIVNQVRQVQGPVAAARLWEQLDHLPSMADVRSGFLSRQTTLWELIEDAKVAPPEGPTAALPPAGQTGWTAQAVSEEIAQAIEITTLKRELGDVRRRAIPAQALARAEAAALWPWALLDARTARMVYAAAAAPSLRRAVEVLHHLGAGGAGHETIRQANQKGCTRIADWLNAELGGMSEG